MIFKYSLQKFCERNTDSFCLFIKYKVLRSVYNRIALLISMKLALPKMRSTYISLCIEILILFDSLDTTILCILNADDSHFNVKILTMLQLCKIIN
jgi:hypothetical protein